MNGQDKHANLDYYDRLFRTRKRFDQLQNNELYRQLAQDARQGTDQKRALDLGCGSGTQSFFLKEQGFSVVAADLSFEATKLTKENANKSGWLLPVVRADAEMLPFKDSSIDACVCSMLLHHFKILEHVAAELRRVVRPGGVIVAVDANAHNPFVRFFFNVVHRVSPRPHMTRNQRALRSSEIERVFAKYEFGDFRFRSLTTALRRDWLGNSLGGTLNFYTRAIVLRMTDLLLPPLCRGNALISVFRRFPDRQQCVGE